MKKILLTGVAGFIGSSIARSLLNQGHCITGIDNLKTGYLENIPDEVNFVQGDCASYEIYQKKPFLDGHFDEIIHFAGQSSGEISFDDPVQDLSDNCISTLNLLKYAKEISCKNFIFASSMSVYGKTQETSINENHSTKPLSMYAVGKLASENYLRIYKQYGISSVSLRLFNTYGPGQNMSNLRQGMVSIYLAQAIQNKSILVKGSPDRFRDFIYIDDVVRVVNHFVKNGINGSEIYNVCTGSKTKVLTIIDTIKKVLGNENILVEYIGATPGDQFGIVGDNTKLIKELKKYDAVFKESDFIDIKTGIKIFSKSLIS